MIILGLILYFNDFFSCGFVVYILEYFFIGLKVCCLYIVVVIELVGSCFCVRFRYVVIFIRWVSVRVYCMGWEES